MGTDETPDEVECWRSPTWARTGAALAFLAAAVGLGLDSALVQGTGWTDLLVLTALLAVLWWVLYGRPRLCLTDRALVVRNVRVHRIPLEDVVSVTPGYGGLVIDRLTGRAVSAWAVQKWNVSWMLGRETRADRLARHLAERLGIPQRGR